MASPSAVVPLKDARLHWSSRWIFPHQPGEQESACTAVACWAGSTLRFFVRGTRVSVRTGANERVDPNNGALPMLVTRVVNMATGEEHSRMFDFLDPGTVVDVVDEDELEEDGAADVLCVQLVMTDWASHVEVVCITVDDIDCVLPLDPFPTIQPSVRALWIGDSITCGFSTWEESDSEDTLMPRGCWDAFPYVAEDALRETLQLGPASPGVDTEIAAFPYATLVVLTEEERSNSEPPSDVESPPQSAEDQGNNTATSAGFGMSEKFFHASPRLFHNERTRLERCAPHIIVIALGTNDEDFDVRPARFRAVMEEFLLNLTGFFHETLSHVVILRPFPWFGTYTLPEWPTLSTCDLSGAIAAVAQADFARGVRFHVWDIAQLGDYNEEHTSDNQHPNFDGHYVLGTNFAQLLQKELCDPANPCGCALCNLFRAAEQP